MPCKDLREFIALLEKEGDLIRIKTEVDPNLEITEICDRTLRAGGPACCSRIPATQRFPCSAICSDIPGAWRWRWVRKTCRVCEMLGTFSPS